MHLNQGNWERAGREEDEISFWFLLENLISKASRLLEWKTLNAGSTEDGMSNRIVSVMVTTRASIFPVQLCHRVSSAPGEALELIEFCLMSSSRRSVCPTLSANLMSRVVEKE